MTLLIDNNGHVPSDENSSPIENYIADEVYDVIDFFYPQTDYVYLPQLYMRPEDIMNIMNCSREEYYVIYKAMRVYFKDLDLRILVPHFCEYMGVDELFIHLFLMSLKKPRKLSRVQKLAMEQLNDDSIELDQPVKLRQILNKPNDFILLDRETFRERTREWHILNPKGEPMCKPIPGWRMVIHSDEVAAICRVHLRTAQQMIKHIRDEQKMERKLPVSIRMFCYYYPQYTEEEIRIGLASMYGEEYNG